MFWKLFKLQQLLDALFDDGWCSLGLAPEGRRDDDHDANVPLHQA